MLASATVPTLYATSIKALGDSIDISANQQIQLIVGSVAQAQGTADAAQSAADSAQEGADFATPLTGAEPPEEAPAAGKLWIDEGQTPSVWRRWRGADVPTDREYEETVSGNADSPAFVSIDNAQGQLQTVALEAGCVAQQAGAGDPSPSNIRAISGRESVEIVACGKNLLDPQYKTFVGPTSMEAHVFWGHPDLFDGIYITAGKSYTISLQNTPKVAGIYVRRWADKKALSYIYDMTTFTFSLEKSEVVYFEYYYSGISAPTSADGLNFQLELGSTATAYEPYTPMGGGVITPSEPLYGLPDAKDTVEVDASGDVTVTRRTAVVELDGTEASHIYENMFYLDQLNLPAPKNLTNGVCSHYGYATYGNGAIGVNASGTSAVYTPNGDYPNTDDGLNQWKSYLAAQKAAGTPVTIVYELAVPETEALTAISPITPEAGPVNIWTDADTLTATVRGSGWEIINDTDGLSEGIDGLLDNVGSLTGRVTLAETAIEQTQQAISLRATKEEVEDSIEAVSGSVDAVIQAVEELGELVVSPEELVSRVTNSTPFQTLQTELSQTASGLTFTQSAVSDIEGRVESLESGVHIGADGIDIYKSNSAYRMHIDNVGWAITGDGQETIAARESKMFAPRVQVNDALIMGRTAWKVGSDGFSRWLKY